MKNNEQTENFTLANYSVTELLEAKKKMLAKQDQLIKAWAKELGPILREPGFDMYSRKGEKRLEKFTQKHAVLLADVLDILSDIDDELSNRESYRFEKSFEESSASDDEFESMTTEDFLRYEQNRIDESRKFIYVDEDDNSDE